MARGMAVPTVVARKRVRRPSPPARTPLRRAIDALDRCAVRYGWYEAVLHLDWHPDRFGWFEDAGTELRAARAAVDVALAALEEQS